MSHQNKERTEAQKQAARLNGAKSRGPVTAEGKAISSQNATRHGLTARRVVLDNESADGWDNLVHALVEEWNPQTATELQIVHDLAAARWRLNRLLDIETESIDIEMARERKAFDQCIQNGTELTRTTLAWQTLLNEGTLPGIHRHETRLRRIIRDSQNQLMALRDHRAAEQNEPAEPLPESETATLQNEPEPPAAATPERPPAVGPANMAQNEPGTSRLPGKTVMPTTGIPGQQPKRPLSSPPGSKAA